VHGRRLQLNIRSVVGHSLLSCCVGAHVRFVSQYISFVLVLTFRVRVRVRCAHVSIRFAIHFLLLFFLQLNSSTKARRQSMAFFHNANGDEVGSAHGASRFATLIVFSVASVIAHATHVSCVSNFIVHVSPIQLFSHSTRRQFDVTHSTWSTNRCCSFDATLNPSFYFLLTRRQFDVTHSLSSTNFTFYCHTPNRTALYFSSSKRFLRV
jgi:hypothetical protein